MNLYIFHDNSLGIKLVRYILSKNKRIALRSARLSLVRCSVERQIFEYVDIDVYFFCRICEQSMRMRGCVSEYQIMSASWIFMLHDFCVGKMQNENTQAHTRGEDRVHSRRRKRKMKAHFRRMVLPAVVLCVPETYLICAAAMQTYSATIQTHDKNEQRKL